MKVNIKFVDESIFEGKKENFENATQLLIYKNLFGSNSIEIEYNHSEVGLTGINYLVDDIKELRIEEE